ncbi:MAG: efflux RND transporter periplasmic adaptor subunit [Deltaproteobacteria bacterium]|nr:efflux RND transporter periplasmic adaptor subunit [Deltaproteobacteria bacterium]
MKNKRRIYLISLAAFIVVVMLVLLFCGRNKIVPGVFPGESYSGFIPKKTVWVAKEKIIDWYEAVGTVRPRTETSIGAQMTAQVTVVNINPGSKVENYDPRLQGYGHSLCCGPARYLYSADY